MAKVEAFRKQVETQNTIHSKKSPVFQNISVVSM